MAMIWSEAEGAIERRKSDAISSPSATIPTFLQPIDFSTDLKAS